MIITHIRGVAGNNTMTIPAGGAVRIGQSSRYVGIKVQDSDGNYLFGSSSSFSTWNPTTASADDPADDLTLVAFPAGATLELDTVTSGSANSWLAIEQNEMTYTFVKPGEYYTAPAGGGKIIGVSSTDPAVRLEDGKNPGTYIWGSATTYDTFNNSGDTPSHVLAQVAIPGGSKLRLSGATNTWISIAH